jgi:ADP-ribosylglycohydrolase
MNMAMLVAGALAMAQLLSRAVASNAYEIQSGGDRCPFRPSTARSRACANTRVRQRRSSAFSEDACSYSAACLRE